VFVCVFFKGKSTNSDAGNVFFLCNNVRKTRTLHVLHWLCSGKCVTVTWMSHERCVNVFLVPFYHRSTDLSSEICLLENFLYLRKSRVRSQVFAVTRGIAGRTVPDVSKGTSISSQKT